MANDYWQIDPKTGDAIMQDGRPVPSNSLIYPAYVRIKAVRNGWLYAPDTNWGSDLATLKKKIGTASLSMIDQALQPMITDGRAVAVDAEYSTTVIPNRNNGAVNVTITPAGGQTQVLELPPLEN